MDAEPLVRGTGWPEMVTAVGVWGRVAYAVGGRRDPRPAVRAGAAYGGGRRPPPPERAGACVRGLRGPAPLLYPVTGSAIRALAVLSSSVPEGRVSGLCLAIKPGRRASKQLMLGGVPRSKLMLGGAPRSKLMLGCAPRSTLISGCAALYRRLASGELPRRCFGGPTSTSA